MSEPGLSLSSLENQTTYEAPKDWPRKVVVLLLALALSRQRTATYVQLHSLLGTSNHRNLLRTVRIAESLGLVKRDGSQDIRSISITGAGVLALQKVGIDI